MRRTQFELCQEIIGGQVTFELMPIDAFAVEDLDCGRPLCAKALKCLRLFLDVDLYRDEVLVDEAFYARVRVDLGIQPSTRASHRCCVEV
jgi:hypothetical protein